MAGTAGDLIDEISAQLHGYGGTADRITPLSNNITATATSFTVDFAFGQAVGVTPGVVEIDSEQLYITAVDQSTGICTLADGFGRGYMNTDPAPHSAGARVISRPKFPRAWLFQKLNEAVGSVFPDLFAVGQYTGTVKFPTNTYNLASTTGTPMGVIDAQWQNTLGDWVSCRSYKLDPFDGTFRLGGGALVGRPLRVLYSTQPNAFTDESDDFSTTGLPDSCSDVLILWVVAHVLDGLDISRAQLSSVEQSDRSRVVPPNAGINAAKFVMAEFEDRLHNEAQSLRRQYRSRIVRV